VEGGKVTADQAHDRWMAELLDCRRHGKSDLGAVKKVSGAYAWWLDQASPVCLKVGIATPRRRDGLRGRLSDHFTSSYGTTTFARHLHRDRSSPWAQGRDLTKPEVRRGFMREHCFFRYLVLDQLDEPALRDFEKHLEHELHPIYLG
jgi:hypothetical protein